jgi:hypothetical protein
MRELSDELTLDSGDPKRECTLSLERWCTLFEGANPKEMSTSLLLCGNLSFLSHLTCGDFSLVWLECCLTSLTHVALPLLVNSPSIL